MGVPFLHELALEAGDALNTYSPRNTSIVSIFFFPGNFGSIESASHLSAVLIQAEARLWFLKSLSAGEFENETHS